MKDEEMKGIVHHLLQVIEPTEMNFSALQYIQMAIPIVSNDMSNVVFFYLSNNHNDNQLFIITLLYW